MERNFLWKNPLKRNKKSPCKEIKKLLVKKSHLKKNSLKRNKNSLAINLLWKNPFKINKNYLERNLLWKNPLEKKTLWKNTLEKKVLWKNPLEKKLIWKNTLEKKLIWKTPWKEIRTPWKKSPLKKPLQKYFIETSTKKKMWNNDSFSFIYTIINNLISSFFNGQQKKNCVSFFGRTTVVISNGLVVENSHSAEYYLRPENFTLFRFLYFRKWKTICYSANRLSDLIPLVSHWIYSLLV